MSWSVKQGDLFLSEAQVISHGVNCKGLMGAGIARAFRERFPAMYAEYRMMCDQGILRPGQIYPFKVRDDLVVINIASQEYPGPDAQYTWLTYGLNAAFHYMQDRDLTSFAMPWIGCGIGGLKIDRVRSIIDGIDLMFPEIEKTVYEL